VQYGHLIQTIQRDAGLADNAQARSLAQACLQAVAERTTGGLAHDFAAQLPQELQGAAQAGDGRTLSGGADAFVERVAQLWRERPADVPVARCARAALGALTGAVTGGQVEDLLGQLPHDLDRLAQGESATASGQAPGHRR